MVISASAAPAQPRQTARERLLPFTVHPSSWLSWATYALGFSLGPLPLIAQDLLSGGNGAVVLGGAVAVFFILVIAIQCHMRLALRASSFGDPDHLVTSGWFTWSRNPMYVAFLIPLASLAYYSPGAAAVASVVYVGLMTTLVIRREERVLTQKFGDRYTAYMRNTPRWLVW